MNRLVILGIGATSALHIATACSAVLYDVRVAPDGSADFTTISQAIAQAPDDHSPYVIYIENGRYPEKLHITRPNLTLIGQDRDKTIITATTANSMVDENGKKFGTFGSRTVSVDAADFQARSLTIENGFDFPQNQKKAKDDPSRQNGTQAVALLISHQGDRAQFRDVSVNSYQDTLYSRAGRAYFDESQISGTVDFIFGHGTVLIERSDIIARYREDTQPNEPLGYITAPATNIDSPYGLVFKGCVMSKEEHVPAGSYALGRPWHPTTQFDDGRYADPNAIGHAAFIDCQIDDHIYGWDKMSGKDINGDKIWFYPQDSRFWEYQNVGQGAAIADDRPQLSDAQAEQYQTQTILSGWLPDISLAPQSTLIGQITHASMQFPAQVAIKDSFGRLAMTESDANGRYRVNIAGMSAPLLISVDDQSGESCIRSDVRRSICATALAVDVNNNGVTTANVNPFSDLIVSNLAAHERIDGPQALFMQERLPALSRHAWKAANQAFQQTFQYALERHGLNPKIDWDPVHYPSHYQPVFNELAAQVIHNLGHNTKTGLLSNTQLFDRTFRPILSQETLASYQLTSEQLSLAAAQATQAQTRLFIVGDSTASNYSADVYPRMGWGQALADKLNSETLLVVNAAQSGRSSRDFINGRWLDFIQPMTKAGDYLLVQFSHNDEKCNGAAKGRGPLDVATLCTYPNSPQGEAQHPDNEPLMSFQHSLERYLTFAKQHEVQPVLLTSVPRAKTDQNQPGTPISLTQHVTKQNKDRGYRFVGDYTQTVRQTSRDNKIPLLDVQNRLVDLANLGEQGEWQSLWLVVDPERYPYYQGRSGTAIKPDVTHFQARGANWVADVVIDEIHQQESLGGLSRKIALATK
ncbi:pectin esterase [Vibrio cholerae]